MKDTFSALSNNTRREILNLLKDKNMTAGDIAENFDVSNATISHHLSVLKESGLVLDEKKGKYVEYELNMSVVEEMLSWFFELRGVENNE